jgi:xylitol oxidase
MNRARRQFLRDCAAVVGGAAATHSSARRPLAAQQPLTNWAGNYQYSTSQLSSAASVKQVQDFVRKHPRFKVLGSRHCFNGIADSAHHLLSMEQMNRVISLDRAAGRVTVGAGMRYGQLCPWLHEQGFGLHNLASLPHISIAGACATATHGSGVTLGNLATAVTGLECVTAGGELVTVSREKDPAVFQGSVVHLGALGVVTTVTLAVQPAFTMRQDVYLDLPMPEVERHFDAIAGSGYSVSLFTDWRNRRVNEVWVKRRAQSGEPRGAPPEFYGARAATKNVHPIVELSAEHCTEQMGVPGPWYERLPHFRMGFTPSSGKELQSEYFVPRSNAVDAILAIERLHDRVSPHLLISELRTIAADDLWMSPCYRRDSLAIHFTWKQEPEAVQRLMPLIEAELGPFGVRPHWGKLFTVPAEALRQRYEKWEAFSRLMKERDPRGALQNQFLASIFRA